MAAPSRASGAIATVDGVSSVITIVAIGMTVPIAGVISKAVGGMAKAGTASALIRPAAFPSVSRNSSAL